MLKNMSYFVKRTFRAGRLLLTCTVGRFRKEGLEVLDQAIDPHLPNSAGDPLSRPFSSEKKQHI
jgi:hypothetical protein